VLLCNGLGTNPYAWPALLRPDCGVRVISWYHRGTGGSARPADRRHVGIEHFVRDALAVMDDAGVDACPVMGWSMGVNTAFELAYLHPERVTGLFAVAGSRAAPSRRCWHRWAFRASPGRQSRSTSPVR
jgi:pimeloyl-ACP methyl ester carboxylesterase